MPKASTIHESFQLVEQINPHVCLSLSELVPNFQPGGLTDIGSNLADFNPKGLL